MRNRKFQKNSKKKTKKIPLWLLLKPKSVGKGRERAKIKIIIPNRSYPTRNRKFQMSSKKIQKIKEHHYGFFSSQSRLERAEKEGK